MIGIMRSSLPEAPDTFAALATAARCGLEGCLFSSVIDISPSPDPLERAEARAEAERQRLLLGAGIGWINPCRPARSGPVLALGDGDLVAGPGRLLDAVATIGIDQMFFAVGTLQDRASSSAPWTRQLDAAVTVIRRLGPRLRDLGIQLLIKTHEEITTPEILSLIEAACEPAPGVALDPVNLFVRLEEPVRGAARIAPHGRQLHLDDATVAFTEGRLRRLLCKLGTGAVDWPSILAQVPVCPIWVELHRGQFAMAIFDPAWMEAKKGASTGELAAIVAHAFRAPLGGGRGTDPQPGTRARDAAHALLAGSALAEVALSRAP